MPTRAPQAGLRLEDVLRPSLAGQAQTPSQARRPGPTSAGATAGDDGRRRRDDRVPVTPTNARALEQELAELPSQIAVYLRELTETPEGIKHRAGREWLAWQVRNLEKRLADVRARLAVLNAKAGGRHWAIRSPMAPSRSGQAELHSCARGA